MRVVYIYVEGKGDLLFISHFLNISFGFELKFDSFVWNAKYKEENTIEIVLQTITPKTGFGGIDSKNIKNLINHIRTVNNQMGIESILIIDADTTNHNNPKGGFQSRKEYLENLKKDVEFKFFIVPNHQENGNLESILDAIICKRGKDFYAFLTTYINGLLSLEGDKRPQYIVENPKLDKEKINWYVYMMEGRGSKSNQNAINPDLWDLETETLKPLKDFFNGIFTL